MDTPPGAMLDATEEARLIGVSVSRVSRVRNTDLGHPANGPHAGNRGAKSRTAPAGLVRAYWTGVNRTPGRRVRAPHALAGLTPTQWAGLEAGIHGRWDTVSPVTRDRLTERGLADATGPTQAGRDLHARHATDGTQTQEHR